MRFAAMVTALLLALVPLTRPSSTEFDWPTSSTTVLRAFDHLEHSWHPGHRGVDLAAARGDEIRAAGPGRVIFAGVVVDRRVVSIEHASRLRTTYLPVTASVEAGDYVGKGDVIGTLEDGHCLIGACLHWGAKRGDIYYDPLALLTGTEIRLYPVRRSRGSDGTVTAPSSTTRPAGPHWYTAV